MLRGDRADESTVQVLLMLLIASLDAARRGFALRICASGNISVFLSQRVAHTRERARRSDTNLNINRAVCTGFVAGAPIIALKALDALLGAVNSTDNIARRSVRCIACFFLQHLHRCRSITLVTAAAQCCHSHAPRKHADDAVAVEITDCTSETLATRQRQR